MHHHTETTKTTYIHTDHGKMCFKSEPGRKYYYHEEYIPVRQVHHHRPQPARVSYHSHRSSASPHHHHHHHHGHGHHGGQVVYEKTSRTRYR